MAEGDFHFWLTLSGLMFCLVTTTISKTKNAQEKKTTIKTGKRAFTIPQVLVGIRSRPLIPLKGNLIQEELVLLCRQEVTPYIQV